MNNIALKRLIQLLLIAALFPSKILAEDDRAYSHGPNSGSGLALGFSMPSGSPVFNKHYLFGANIRTTGFRRQNSRLLNLWTELELGMDLMAAQWGSGFSLSFPVFMNASYDIMNSRKGCFGTGIFGGLGFHFHQFNSGINGVAVANQVQPSVQIGLNAGMAISSKWAIILRSVYTRSFTSNQVAEFAEITIRSRDRYGYGSILFMVGLSKGI